MNTRTLALFLPTLVLTACPADPGDDSDATSPGETGDETDTTEEPAPVYPDGDRILLYHGHGGPEEEDSGWGRFDLVDTHWKDVYGWNTDYRSYFPSDMEDYRAVFFIAPGYTGEETFSGKDLTLLRAALEQGTRMIVLEEKDGCALQSPNALLEGLGATMRFSGSGLGEYQTATIEDLTEHQITSGVASIKFRDACHIDAADGLPLARHNDEYLVAVERVGAGGEVVLIGDFEFLDDSGPREWAMNGLLADRLVEIDPANAVD